MLFFSLNSPKILSFWLFYLCLTNNKANGLASTGVRRSHRPSPPQSERTVVILYHKPAGIVTTHNSQDDRPTVYNEVQSMSGFLMSNNEDSNTKSTNAPSFADATGIRSTLHAIGRLDADTSGLLLLTNDGSLVHHVTNPTANQKVLEADFNSQSSHGNYFSTISKTYEAVIMGHHTEKTLQSIRDGVDIGAKYGGMTKPVDDLQILEHPNHKSTIVSISISEGKNRQIRRMFHAIGSGVMKLQRIKIGDSLTLEGVEEGQWRLLSEEEVRNALHWEPRKIQVVSAEVSGKPRRRTRNATAARQRRKKA
jgi:23S rRNA pseudouridine2605 synthase